MTNLPDLHLKLDIVFWPNLIYTSGNKIKTTPLEIKKEIGNHLAFIKQKEKYFIIVTRHYSSLIFFSNALDGDLINYKI